MAVPRSEDFAHLLFRVYGTMHGTFFRAVAPVDDQGRPSLGRPELGLLGFLHVAGEASLGEAAERCHMSKSQLTLIVDKLVEKGMLERKPDGNDRRSATISSTKAGERALAEAFAEVRLRVEAWFAPLSARELATVRKSLELMARLIEHHENAE